LVKKSELFLLHSHVLVCYASIFICLKIFKISFLMSTFTQWLIRSIFNFHKVVSFLRFSQVLISSCILLWWKKIFDMISMFYFFAVLGLELRAYILSYSTSPFFVMGFFKIGSHKLFPWAGFEP
jgi:hypothetical protein